MNGPRPQDRGEGLTPEVYSHRNEGETSQMSPTRDCAVSTEGPGWRPHTGSLPSRRERKEARGAELRSYEVEAAKSGNLATRQSGNSHHGLTQPIAPTEWVVRLRFLDACVAAA